MLTEAQFREIADSIQNIVVELKKMNEQPMYTITASPPKFSLTESNILNEYEKEHHSGPSIA